MAEDHEVRIFAGRWSAAERGEILAELDRRDIQVRPTATTSSCRATASARST